MWRQPLISVSWPWRMAARVLLVLMLITATIASTAVVSVLNGIEYGVELVTDPDTAPFPVSVNPTTAEIIEQPDVEQFFQSVVAAGPRTTQPRTIREKLVGLFTESAWLQNLALSSSRMLVIYAGERHEEVATNFGYILNWDQAERQRFINEVQAAYPTLPEGIFFPGKYLVAREAEPEAVAAMLTDSFEREVQQRYPDTVHKIVPLETAIIVASLLEREAYDFTDMREISGIIWNRLFIDMPLQLDATLQYVRGNESSHRWWPIPRASDKWIDSPFNTYQNEGLPPHAIANPSLEAVLAALNPIQTDCIFYLHAANGTFHCSSDYRGHQANINRYLR